MRFVGLLSGGKDSYYSMVKAIRQGHQLICLASLYTHTELDSSMFQSTGTTAVPALSQALQKPLITSPLTGKSLNQEMVYAKTEGDEIEDLWELLTGVKYRYPEVEAVVSGAVFSNYQRLRIEDVCARLGLVSIAPLWRIDQTRLLQEQLDSGVESILVKVASMGLTPAHLGKTIRELQPYFEELRVKFGFNVCGEGGEYETLVVDSPEMTHKLVLNDTQITTEGNSDISCSAYLTYGSIDLVNKTDGSRVSATLPAVSMVYPKIYKTISHFATGELVATDFESRSEFSGIEDETYTILQGAKRTLLHNGLSLQEVYYVHATLKSMDDFARFNQVYKSFFNRPGPPARCCVETSGQRQRVKMYLRGTKQKQAAVHVQSVNSWAPANVGPYSQAIELQGKFHMAGTIALVPSTMQLSPDQLSQCLTNATAIAASEKYDLTQNDLAVVYFTGQKPTLTDNFHPFYIEVTRIPKDGNVEIEFHLRKSPIELKIQEIPLIGENYRANMHCKFSPDVLFMVCQVSIESCTDPIPLLTAIKSHLDGYFASITHKSPTKEEELMSSVSHVKSVLDYVTEMRVTGRETGRFKVEWTREVPVLCMDSGSEGMLICVEDRLQMGTYEYLQGGS